MLLGNGERCGGGFFLFWHRYRWYRYKCWTIVSDYTPPLTEEQKEEPAGEYYIIKLEISKWRFKPPVDVTATGQLIGHRGLEIQKLQEELRSKQPLNNRVAHYTSLILREKLFT